MPEQAEWYKKRVGIYLMPHTRNKLNVVKADLALHTGRVLSHDDVVNALVDHYTQTADKPQAIAELITA